jgi:hypothetical protein
MIKKVFFSINTADKISVSVSRVNSFLISRERERDKVILFFIYERVKAMMMINDLILPRFLKN